MIDVAALDQYRAGYRANMPYQDHRVFYDQLAAEYPEQNYWDKEQCAAFLDWYWPRWIVELGGWDGALAAAMLKKYHDPDMSWFNYEIATVPQVCTDHRYHFDVDTDWLWADGPGSIPCDAFIASHVLEHLTEQHLDALISALDCDAVYIDVPLDDYGNTWDGTTTTHILPLSMPQFDAKWTDAGWTITHAAHSPKGVPSHIRFLERA